VIIVAAVTSLIVRRATRTPVAEQQLKLAYNTVPGQEAFTKAFFNGAIPSTASIDRVQISSYLPLKPQNRFGQNAAAAIVRRTLGNGQFEYKAVAVGIVAIGAPADQTGVELEEDDDAANTGHAVEGSLIATRPLLSPDGKAYEARYYQTPEVTVSQQLRLAVSVLADGVPTDAGGVTLIK